MIFYRINTNNDTVKILFIYFVSWCNVKIDFSTFDLNKIPMRKVKELYDDLKNEYDAKYHI